VSSSSISYNSSTLLYLKQTISLYRKNTPSTRTVTGIKMT